MDLDVCDAFRSCCLGLNNPTPSESNQESHAGVLIQQAVCRSIDLGLIRLDNGLIVIQWCHHVPSPAEHDIKLYTPLNDA